MLESGLHMLFLNKRGGQSTAHTKPYQRSVCIGVLATCYVMAGSQFKLEMS